MLSFERKIIQHAFLYIHNSLRNLCGGTRKSIWNIDTLIASQEKATTFKFSKINLNLNPYQWNQQIVLVFGKTASSRAKIQQHIHKPFESLSQWALFPWDVKSVARNLDQYYLQFSSTDNANFNILILSLCKGIYHIATKASKISPFPLISSIYMLAFLQQQQQRMRSHFFSNQ